MFDDYFDVYLADTSKGKEEHYKLRYQVYCEEMGFEDKTLFSSKLEKDQWDDRSVHFLVRHRESGQWVGAMRMVSKQNDAFPMQSLCSIDIDEFSHGDIEISRLCLIQDIRKRKTDKEPPLGLNTRADTPSTDSNITDLYSRRQINRSLIWGLFRAALIYSVENRIENWYFLSTKALARIISREGFKMNRIGEVCHHRGERFPFKIDINEIQNNELWSQDFHNGYLLFSDLENQEKLLCNRAA